jgi:hypothetical protein
MLDWSEGVLTRGYAICVIAVDQQKQIASHTLCMHAVMLAAPTRAAANICGCAAYLGVMPCCCGVMACHLAVMSLTTWYGYRVHCMVGTACA